MARSLLDGPTKRMALRARNISRLRLSGARAGFTLVELMIVVAIVGVLAVIAVVAYRKITLNSKLAEARNMISAIRLAQEAYKTETGVYADVGGTVCPNAGGTAGTLQRKWGWTPACFGGNLTWESLPVHADGPVQFGYTTRAGVGGGALNVGEPVPFVPVPAPASPTTLWYYVTASADLDGQGGLFTEAVGTSYEGTLHTANDGF